MDVFDPIRTAAEIVAAFLSYNSVPPGDVPGLIETVHAAIMGSELGANTRTRRGGREASANTRLPTPAVSIRMSITPEYLICLEDGKRFKTLKRHLTSLGMTPDEYRAKWDLHPGYPMVAPGYAAKRSALAKSMGLGQVRSDPARHSTQPSARRKRSQPSRAAT